MTIINLRELFEGNIAKQQRRALPSQPKQLDDKILQSSFEFPDATQVRVVSDIHRLQPVHTFSDLQPLVLPPQDQAAVAVNLATLRKNPDFYDGEHLLVTQAVYDDEEKTIYLECKATRYSVLNTLLKNAMAPAYMSLPEDGVLRHLQGYQTGVLTPFITTDGYTVFLERKDNKLYSVAAGYCQPIGERGDLANIFIKTALKEAIEEVLGTDENTSEFQQFIQNFTAPPQEEGFCTFPFSLLPFALPVGVASASFYKTTENNYGVMEFVVPIRVNCTRAELEALVQSNRAKDKNEHTGQYELVPLAADTREAAIDFLKRQLPGQFLYGPILHAAASYIDPRIIPHF